MVGGSESNDPSATRENGGCKHERGVAAGETPSAVQQANAIFRCTGRHCWEGCYINVGVLLETPRKEVGSKSSVRVLNDQNRELRGQRTCREAHDQLENLLSGKSFRPKHCQYQDGKRQRVKHCRGSGRQSVW